MSRIQQQKIRELKEEIKRIKKLKKTPRVIYKTKIEKEYIKVLAEPEKPKKQIKVRWFCKQCRVVAKGTVAKGTNIECCTCHNCGAKELLAVSRIMGDPFDW